MTANWPIPETNVGSRRTAARVTLGAISLSNSGHFPHRLKSGHGRMSNQCPLYPRKRTSLSATEMSALCQKRTFCAAGGRSLFDRAAGSPGLGAPAYVKLSECGILLSICELLPNWVAVTWMILWAFLGYIFAPYGMWKHHRTQLRGSSQLDQK